MTAATKSLREAIQPEIEKRLAEYERTNPLSNEERATVRVVLSSMILSERIKKQEATYKVLLFTQLN